MSDECTEGLLLMMQQQHQCISVNIHDRNIKCGRQLRSNDISNSECIDNIPNLRTYWVVIAMLSTVQMKLNSTDLCRLFELQFNGVIVKSQNNGNSWISVRQCEYSNRRLPSII